MGGHPEATSTWDSRWETGDWQAGRRQEAGGRWRFVGAGQQRAMGNGGTKEGAEGLLLPVVGGESVTVTMTGLKPELPAE